MKLGIPAESAKQIARLLVGSDLINEDQLSSASISSTEGEKCLIETIIEYGFTDEISIATAISEKYDIELIEILTQSEASFSLSGVLPKKYIIENRVVPIRNNKEILDVVISEPSALNQMSSIGLLTEKKIKPHLVTFSQINDILTSFNSDQIPIKSKEKSNNLNIPKTTTRLKTKTVKKEPKPSSEVIDFVDKYINKAVMDGVSDIHLEKYKKYARMRFRLDGVFIIQKDAEKLLFEKYEAIVTVIKIKAGVDITERRLPQDGAMNEKIDGKEVDFRVSILPASEGERVVMRILDTSSISLTIESLGFQEDGELAFKKSIDSPQGMVLVTGPTGSGKSTTLYAALQRIDLDTKNVLTAEDPVEFTLDGISQVQVKDDIGLTFSAALRSFLRQDPDVVMVGEIRDKETVDIAIKAALTGHLVLSTLHTNDAVSTINRLVNMGVEPYLIASSLTLIVAQRLARKVCENCKTEDSNISGNQKIAIGFSPEESSRLRLQHGEGCSDCNDTGYKGRLGIYEVLNITENIVEGILSKRTTPELLKIAKEKDSFLSMQEVGRSFLRSGSITYEEYQRVLITD